MGDEERKKRKISRKERGGGHVVGENTWARRRESRISKQLVTEQGDSATVSVHMVRSLVCFCRHGSHSYNCFHSTHMKGLEGVAVFRSDGKGAAANRSVLQRRLDQTIQILTILVVLWWILLV